MPILKKVDPGARPWPEGALRCVGEDEHERRVLLADEKPNFAGDWIIVECTCGIECGRPFMWNARTGSVYRDFPVDALFRGDLYSNSRGLVHRANSRLLIIEGYVDEVGEEGWRGYFEWNGSRFIPLHRVALESLSTP